MKKDRRDTYIDDNQDKIEEFLKRKEKKQNTKDRRHNRIEKRTHFFDQTKGR